MENPSRSEPYPPMEIPDLPGEVDDQMAEIVYFMQEDEFRHEISNKPKPELIDDENLPF